MRKSAFYLLHGEGTSSPPSFTTFAPPLTEHYLIGDEVVLCKGVKQRWWRRPSYILGVPEKPPG